MRCLFVTTVLPRGTGSGGEIVSQSVIEALGRCGMEVCLLGYQRAGETAPVRAGEVCVGRRPIETSGAGAWAIMWMATALLRRAPYSQMKYHSWRLRRAVAGALRAGPDLVLVDHAQVGFALAHVRSLAAPVVLIAHNVEADGYAELAASASRRLSRWVHARESRLMARAERDLAQRCDQVWALTGEDAAHFAALAGGAQVRTLEVASRLGPADHEGRSVSAGQGCDLALIGNWTWRANARGLQWFAREVIPRLPPSVRVEVAGRGAEWLRGRHANVVIRGVVPDAPSFLARARAIAVPSELGTGVQIKTLDAIASGAQVIATPVAVRGLGPLPGSVEVAGDGAGFADAVRRALERPASSSPDPEAIAWSRERSGRFDRSVRDWVNELVAAGR